MVKSINIDKERCIRCGMCINDCFVGCLAFAEDGFPAYTEEGRDRCVGCQHCMMICPKGALSFGDKKADNCLPIGFGNSEDLLSLIRSRRSVRSYKKQDVPAEKLEQICAMLAYPPKGGNFDTLHFTIVETRAKMAEVAEKTYEEVAKLTDNPFAQFATASWSKGVDAIYKGAPAIIVVSVDPSKVAPQCETVDPIIALSYTELYAQSLGLGTLWDDFAVMMIKQSKPLQNMLQIPEGYEVSFVMTLGIPAVNYKRVPQKEPANITIMK